MQWSTTRASLLIRLRDPHDDAAWAEFDRLYGDLILRSTRRLGLDTADGEDVRQMVLLGLVRSMPHFEFRPERGRFRGYLGRAVRNAIVRFRSRQTGTRLVLRVNDGVEPTIACEDDWDEVWEEEWRLHHLRRALASIRQAHDPRTLAVFQDLLDGLSVQEVAASRGMTRDAVHKVKQRLRDQLRSIIAN
ncbi:MAG: sigma-70 family RNA polymerase sigma factor, partial [Candidatus Eisenbacteria bacterium]|nr:sigma-70 family RNA polymerase sigma factor [Candidatus Eisenbacteria bacterium]